MGYYHFEVERKERRLFIEKHIGYGEPVATVNFKSETSDRTRINVLTDKGIIFIYNRDWHIVTIMIASYPQALKIYRKAHDEEPPEWMKSNFIEAARWKEYEP